MVCRAEELRPWTPRPPSSSSPFKSRSRSWSTPAHTGANACQCVEHASQDAVLFQKVMCGMPSSTPSFDHACRLIAKNVTKLVPDNEAGLREEADASLQSLLRCCHALACCPTCLTDEQDDWACQIMSVGKWHVNLVHWLDDL